jgi:DNA (cytosine-5)-methyltransferase 1
VGAMPVEAASGNADQLRDRFWFVADADEQRPCPRLQRGGQFSRTGGDTKDHPKSMAGGGGARLEGLSGESRDNGPQLATVERSGVWPMVGAPSFGWGEGWSEHELRSGGITAAVASIGSRQVIECPGGKWRTLPPPRVRWLGNGIPTRVAKLRAFGNAIVPQVAAEFIAAYMDTVANPS